MDTLLQNIEWVEVLRSNYGSCDSSQRIWQYANCAESEMENNLTGNAFSASSKREPMRLYPNPSQGWLQLQFSHAAERQIEVLDEMGRRILSPQQSHQNVHRLDLSDLPPGLYLIRSLSAYGVCTKSVVKQ